MSNLTTFQRLKERVADKTGVNLEDTPEVGDFINEAGDDFAREYDWHWRRKEGFVVTTTEANAGTVTFTQDSATVTGVGTAFTSAMKGRKIAKASRQPWYRVKSVQGATSLTLDRAYPQATEAGASYVLYQDTYALPPEVEELRGEVWLHDEYGYPVCQLAERDLGYLHRGVGRPYWYAVTHGDGSDQLYLQVGPYAPDTIYQIRYRYLRGWIPLSDPADAPVVPRRHLDIVCKGAEVKVYGMPQFKGSGLAETAESRYTRMLMKAKKDGRQRGNVIRIALPGMGGPGVGAWPHVQP